MDFELETHLMQKNKIMDSLMKGRTLDKSNEPIAIARGSEPAVRCKPTFSAGNAATHLA